jgi:hypothetical protein
MSYTEGKYEGGYGKPPAGASERVSPPTPTARAGGACRRCWSPRTDCSYFSRLRRSEIGQHHRISGHLLHQYANEAAWREDHRRQPKGTNWRLVTNAALTQPKSPVWAGNWHKAAA